MNKSINHQSKRSFEPLLIRRRYSHTNTKTLFLYSLDSLTTQASLLRLHLALRAANQAVTGRLEFGVNLVSNHSLTAEDAIAAYQEVRLRGNSLVFRLQVHKAGEDGDSRLLLAETLCDKPAVNVESSEQANLTGTTIALLPLDPEGADAFVPITHATTPGHTSDTHHIFQDVSANWARTSTLAELLSEDAPERPSRYSLAALLGSSRLCFAADKLLVDDSQAHEYHYYDCGSKEETHTGDEKAAIIRDHNRLLSPYLVSGFGSPPRKVSTRAFGGARGAAPVYDPQIVNLGLLLYQIGHWHPLEHASSISARMEQRTVVKEHMHDLYRETGMGFAETVQLCLDWRYTPPNDQLAGQIRLYEKVVVTLRKLDEAVTVQPYELG